MKFTSNEKPKVVRRGRTPNKPTDPFIFCLDCLRNGKENFDHFKTHSYHIVDKLEQSLFTNSFNVKEESAFIHGVAKWGLDNWRTLSRHLNHSKDYKELCNHFYSYYYDVYAISEGSKDPLKYLKNRSNHDIDLANRVINALTQSMVLSKLPNEKEEVNQELLQQNLQRELKINRLMEDHFEATCGIGKDANRPRATRGRRSELNCKNKKIAKIINYNAKRREFTRDDECEENEEKTICELNFNVPNYGVDGEIAEKAVKKDGRKKKNKKDEFLNHDIPEDKKIGALNHYIEGVLY